MENNTTAFGVIGTVATFTLGQANHIVGILAGLLTCSWVIYSFVKEFKKK
jgi:hypothetical protein